MSSGECMLISLLHFIYNSLIRKSLPNKEPILMLIDEIELALHPVAITNLMDLLQNLTDEYDNLTVIITTHSPEVIRKICPSKMYKMEKTNANNNFQIVNPCYPSYAIRDVYTHDGYDYLILVEDLLAKRIVQQSVLDTGLNKSRLVNVTPVGGWTNVLQLQRELNTENVLGIGKKVLSVLDGDVNGKPGKEYKSLKKIYLPISSVEKYLKENLIDKPFFQIKKDINDTFFPINSIEVLIAEYKKQENTNKKQLGEKYKEDNDGKRFYKILLANVESRKISEIQFVDGLYNIIKNYVNTTKFNQDLVKELT